jgi:hypothetical protein
MLQDQTACGDPTATATSSPSVRRRVMRIDLARDDT